MRGPAYPLQNQTDGQTLCQDYTQLGASWIKAFVMATPGSRPMRQAWGVGLKRMQFDPAKPEMFEAWILHRLRKLEAECPLLIKGVTCQRDAATNNQRMRISVSYQMLATGETSETTVEV